MSLSREDAFRFVWLIGLVSLFSDMTYQGAHGNAGPYLAILGAGGTVVGIVAGAGELVNYTLRLLFGWWADKTRAYWWIAFPGYALNLIAVPCLALCGHWPAAAACLILERTGKGIRTPARDVMLSHAADQVGRGWAFGVHEAMDQTGGMLGPLLVAGMIFFNQGYRAGFAVLAIPAALALVCLTITWRLYPHTEDIHRKPVDLNAHGLPRSFWILVAGMGCLALGYADFALMAFHFKTHELLSPAWIPVSYGLAMGLQGLASLGFGQGYDRWGVKALIVAALPASAFAPLVFLGSPRFALLGLALWTVGMGAQGSIMKALVAELVPAERRGSAYGILNSSYGLCWFLGSATMGWLYDHSLPHLVLFSVVAQLASLPFLFLIAGPKKVS
jgi:predicted MFS family arabinose efflux permease